MTLAGTVNKTGVLVLLALVASRFKVFSEMVVPVAAAVNAVPIIAFAWASSVAIPAINRAASTRPLVEALQRQDVAPEEIALHSCPHLWTTDMPRQLEAALSYLRGQIKTVGKTVADKAG